MSDEPKLVTASEKLRHEIAQHLDELPHGWCRVEKAWRLAEIIIENKLETIIEIGIFGGRSIVPMALAVREQGKGCVFGIDPWDNKYALEGDNGKEQEEWWAKLDMEAIRESFESHANKHKLWEWLKWSRFGSVEITPFFKDGSWDMVHLDGDHAEVTSCRDVRLWVPKVRPGGFLVMDDVNWPTQAKAVAMLTQELGMGFIEQHEYEDGQAWGLYYKPKVLKHKFECEYAGTDSVACACSSLEMDANFKKAMGIA